MSHKNLYFVWGQAGKPTPDLFIKRLCTPTAPLSFVDKTKVYLTVSFLFYHLDYDVFSGRHTDFYDFVCAVGSASEDDVEKKLRDALDSYDFIEAEVAYFPQDVRLFAGRVYQDLSKNKLSGDIWARLSKG